MVDVDRAPEPDDLRAHFINDEWTRTRHATQPADNAHDLAGAITANLRLAKEPNMKFRKKPVEVEVMHLTPVSAGRVVQWINENGGDAIMRGGPKGGSHGASIGILTLEGRIWYEPGWVVIQGVQGEFYACRADIFEQTYEPVDE